MSCNNLKGALIDLEDVKYQHPELHELVYQAMTKTLFSRINRG